MSYNHFIKAGNFVQETGNQETSPFTFVNRRIEKVAHKVMNLRVAPTSLITGAPTLPSSKYYTLRYLLAATLAEGESTVAFPAASDDSKVLFRGCQAFGAELRWRDEQQQLLFVRGVGRPQSTEPITINAGSAGAVLRLLLGIGALVPEVTYLTDQPQSLGKRPNRELLEALGSLGAVCEGTGQ